MLAWAFTRMPGDPLFAGLAVSAAFAGFGALFGKKYLSHLHGRGE